MSTPIPSKPRTFSFPSQSHSPDNSNNASPQLVTPAGTPPPNLPNGHNNALGGIFQGPAEQRLRQLLMNFDAGTHTICRDERESPAERRLSHGDLDAEGKKQIRHPSFLSSLSLSRPFNYPSNPSSSATTPAQTPVSGSFGLSHGFGFGMTPAHPQTHEQSDTLPSGDMNSRPSHVQSKSTPVVPSSLESLPQAEGVGMMRSKSQVPVKQKGFDLSHVDVKRHFDPSKEPRLLGLL